MIQDDAGMFYDYDVADDSRRCYEHPIEAKREALLKARSTLSNDGNNDAQGVVKTYITEGQKRVNERYGEGFRAPYSRPLGSLGKGMNDHIIKTLRAIAHRLGEYVVALNSRFGREK